MKKEREERKKEKEDEWYCKACRKGEVKEEMKRRGRKRLTRIHFIILTKLWHKYKTMDDPVRIEITS